MNVYYLKEIGNIQQKKEEIGNLSWWDGEYGAVYTITHTRIGTNLVNFTIATSLNMENNDPCGIGKKIIWAAHAKVKW